MKKLTKIRLINWHYFANEEININGNVLLTGQNATGKSTILDAITFVLTAGDTQFNVAANENGKRDLKSYVKCKISREDKEYLREGDVIGHIALEFYDEEKDQIFSVGTVIDAFGDLLPATVIFWLTYEPIRESFFVDERGILSTSDFKKHNPQMEVFKTRKEAKRVFRTTFGNLGDDFYRLIHKALAFKPISDVKEFIYDHLLEEKMIDVANIKEAIRAYKQLEDTLNIIKRKIADLHVIDDLYQEIKVNIDQKNFYSYVLQLLEEKSIKIEIDRLKEEKRNASEKSQYRMTSIKEIDQKIESLDQRSKELYRLLSSNDEFVQNEYVDKQILKNQSLIEELTHLEKDYLANVSQLKDKIREMRRIVDTDALKRLSNLNLSSVSLGEIEQVKLNLVDIQEKIDDDYDRVLGLKNSYENQKTEIIKDINEISQTLKGLENRNLRYNPMVNALKAELEAGLKNTYGSDISVYVLAELLEITDPAWADTVEVYLNRRRFNLIVEPRYYDAALQIYNKVKNTRNIYGVGLVNTKKLGQYSKPMPNSMATIIKSDNVDAMRYINYLVGNLILCDDVMDLEKYSAAITNEGMLYQGYVVSSMNYNNVDRPFIGKDATDRQLQKYNKLALEKKESYIEITEQIEKYNEVLKAYNQIDLRNIIQGVGLNNRINDAKTILEELRRQKANKEAFSISNLEKEYNDVNAEIKRLNEEKSQILESSGQVKEQIANLEAQIASLEARLIQIGAELKELKLNNIAIEKDANKELELAFSKTNDLRTHQTTYARLVSEREDVVSNLGNRLSHLQFNYNTTYNTIYGVGISEMPVFLKELNKLEKSEIVTYEQKVRSAREDAELLFREDFLSKLRNYILTAEDEINKINETLKTIRFGEDSYEFIFLKSKEFSIFYEMVTSDFNSSDTGLLALDFEMRYNEQLEELFSNLAMDEDNAKGAINRFTDYRTYMDYDIKITNHVPGNEHCSYYSQVFKLKSGGETQVPFYVAIIASFVRAYTRNNINNSAIGLALFDEAFNNLDGSRMKAMMNFINSMPIQIILACPADRMKVLAPYTKTTVVAFRKGINAATNVFDSKDVK